jgi:hypothetical protein
VHAQEAIADERRGGVARLRRRPRRGEALEDVGGARRRAEPGGPRTREQARDEVGAVGRDLEERLVEEVEVPVVAADVHDERRRRPEPGDVGEVLFGADADVDAAARPDPPRVLGDARLVRHEIVRQRERAVRLRQRLDERPELGVAHRRRQRGRVARRGRQQHDGAREPSAHGA